MLTNEDIQKLIEVFATKDDLKESISGLSTKDDFNKLFSAIALTLKRPIVIFRKW